MSILRTAQARFWPCQPKNRAAMAIRAQCHAGELQPLLDGAPHSPRACHTGCKAAPLARKVPGARPGSSLLFIARSGPGTVAGLLAAPDVHAPAPAMSCQHGSSSSLDSGLQRNQ